MENNNTGFRAKIQKFGGVLSGMVMPNIGAFITWGLITAIFLQTGWHPNAHIAKLISPMLSYLLPILIGYTGGKNFYGDRGGVIGAAATMGVIVGADIPMFMGAMIMGPVAALCMKQVDKLFEGKIKPGFEMIVNNFSMGILGIFLVLAAYYAINHGILSPIGITQAAKAGKSILFILEPNPGPGVGVLLAYTFFGTGTAKRTAPGVAIIHAFGGIHEPYFPFILMKPQMIIASICGAVSGNFVFEFFNCGLVATASPGSYFSVLAVAPKSDYLPIIAGMLLSTAVSFAVGSIILKLSKGGDDYDNALEKKDAMKAEGKQEEKKETIIDLSGKVIKKVYVACDAGMGSSAMGASILRKKMKEAGFDDIEVKNVSIPSLPEDVDIVVTLKSLTDRAIAVRPNAIHYSVENFLEGEQYDAIIEKIKETR